jgi:hypothetical protein
VSEIDNAEPLVTLALGEPSLIPPAFADILDAVSSCEPGVIDDLIDELTIDNMEVIKSIAALVTLRQAAIRHQTFTEWLGTQDARQLSSAYAIAVLMGKDSEWPRKAITYTEFRDYIAERFPHSSDVFNRAWAGYRTWALAPYGDVGTIRTETQYAARIAWNSGYDEIHPETVNGVSRFEAESRAGNYNLLIQGRHRGEDLDPGASASASVVRRTVVYGPWYAI